MAVEIKKLSIVIPCYNEERTVHLILDKVLNVKLVNDIEKELIIVNDCSKDNTIGAIEKYFAAHPNVNYTLYSHEVNKGKGAALHTGIKNGYRRICYYSGCRFGIRSTGV